ncbi:hypothetical protein OCU04_007586 [Sclerotinia nivalis]|uniref:Uncharacterized protein n=1 Tax=Sclerotinia nivalis TaxID=352851 RepID=A0A9X0DK56_9HELO|nr:hypothetical protein OCU04_007586 [Sclerotinia nivalis]
MLTNEEEPNFRIFLDCISTPLIERCTSASNPNSSKRKTRGKAKAGRKGAIKPISKDVDVAGINDAAELADFIEVDLPSYFPIYHCREIIIQKLTRNTSTSPSKYSPISRPISEHYHTQTTKRIHHSKISTPISTPSISRPQIQLLKRFPPAFPILYTPTHSYTHPPHSQNFSTQSSAHANYAIVIGFP